jgi:MFS family permease
MGVAYGAYAAAFVVGSSIGGFVVEALGLRAPFALYLGIAALSTGLVAALAGGQRAERETTGHGVAVTPRIVTTEPARARSRRTIAYATGFVYVYGLGTVLAFLPAYGADRALSPRGVGLLLGAYWIARVVGSLGAGRVAEALGPRLVLVPAMLTTAAGSGLVVAPLGTSALLLGTLALGLAAGASAPTCVALIADHVSAEERGTAMGLFEAACGASILASGLLGGVAAEGLGGEAPYAIAGALGLVWAGVLARALPSGGRV